MADAAPAPAEPRPAASVIIVRDAPPGAPEPIEVYMVRRQRSMKFLGGFYAFPGGKVDPGDAASTLLAGCLGLDAARAAQCFPAHGPLPPGQAPRLYTEETSEGFWIHPGDGYRRFLAHEMAMAEPAEYGLAYIAQFRSVSELWAACDDNREKFTGVVDRIEFQFWKDFDWKAERWNR